MTIDPQMFSLQSADHVSNKVYIGEGTTVVILSPDSTHLLQGKGGSLGLGWGNFHVLSDCSPVIT